MRRILSALALVALTSPALAHDLVKGDLHIIHPTIPVRPASAQVVGGYVTISNNGTAADRLIAAESTAAKEIQIHTTEHGTDGMAKMVQIPALDLPPGETVVLERGGMHIMFMGLTAPLAEGAMVPVTLVFEKAGRVEVEFEVGPAPEPAAGGHTGH